MPWSDLETKDSTAQVKEAQERAAKIAKQYARCFETDDGKAVLEDLVSNFVMSNDLPFEATNINYQAAYKNGEAGLVKYILNQIKRASII